MGALLSKQIKKRVSLMASRRQSTTPEESAPSAESAAMEASFQHDLEVTKDKLDNSDTHSYCILFEQRGSLIEKIVGPLVTQYGCEVAILKSGWRVDPAEATAMRLVTTHSDVPSPRVLDTLFIGGDKQIIMTFMPGQPLDKVWIGLEPHHKERICRELWVMIRKIRLIPRPPELEGLYVCLADGSPSQDPLLRNLVEPAIPITSDEEVRARIYEIYYDFNGRKYEKVLPDMLPRSLKSVFTHADIAPRNIMVDEEFRITGLLDWEMAGWFPDYWEYVNITRPNREMAEWKQLMMETAPKEFRCNLQGIHAARNVIHW